MNQPAKFKKKTNSVTVSSFCYLFRRMFAVSSRSSVRLRQSRSEAIPLQLADVCFFVNSCLSFFLIAL